jgi:hypothetical protein
MQQAFCKVWLALQLLRMMSKVSLGHSWRFVGSIIDERKVVYNENVPVVLDHYLVFAGTLTL